MDVSDDRTIDILDVQYDSADVNPRESDDIDTETQRLIGKRGRYNNRKWKWWHDKYGWRNDKQKDEKGHVWHERVLKSRSQINSGYIRQTLYGYKS